jgi:hypothetical protein
MSSSNNRPIFLKSQAALFALLLGAAAAPGCSSAGKTAGGGTGGDDNGGTGGDTGGSGGSGATGGSTGGKGGSAGSGPTGGKGGSGGSTGGSGGGSGGSGGSTGGSGGGSGGSPPDSGTPEGGAGGTMATGSAPCTEMPDMMPPALKRGTPITGFAGQAGQVVGVPGEPNMMYVIGHANGNVYVVQDLKVLPAPLLNVKVAGNGNGPEQGLLGIALHPQFATNHLMYIMYTAAGSGAITVDEFERMTPTTAMFKQNVHSHAGSNMYHNGGSIYFSPKDPPGKALLYHSVGNAQSGGNSASPTSMNGKVLRYDVATKMGVPNMGATAMTYAYGLRNPYRMSVDRLTGDLWIGEVADGPGGAVFFLPFDAPVKNFGYGGGGEIQGGISGFQGGNAALIGGVVYRGNKIKGLCGRYFFGMHSNGAIKSLVQMGGMRVGAVADHATLTVPGQLSSFGEDGEGEIWMSSRSQNAIFKIEAGP